MSHPEYDATRCPKCGDEWEITRVQPAVTGARAVDLRICQCDKPRCANAKCKRSLPFAAVRCPHCDRPLWS